MNKLIPVFYDVSDWNIQSWVTTTGTRAKCYIEEPSTEKLYFFKESIDRYPSEFWSEIIASKVGQYLGFDMLDYNIAIHREIVGCISENMIDSDHQELIHGINLLKKEIAGFKVSQRPMASIEQIEKVLSRHSGFINSFIDVMIFDSLIGNQDRHTENWALVRSLNAEYVAQNTNRTKKFIIDIYNKYLKDKNVPFRKFLKSQWDDVLIFDYKFSKIYDSGSSLGREISEEKLTTLISDQKLLNYINKGMSEIRIQGRKVNHFHLLQHLLLAYQQHITVKINKIISLFHADEFRELVMGVDTNLPPKYGGNGLSLQRKDFICRNIESRVKLLQQLLP